MRKRLRVFGLMDIIPGHDFTNESKAPSAVYPILKPANSVAIERGALYTPLELHATNTPGDIVIAYARDAGDSYELLTAADLGENDRDEWHSIAIRNIAELERRFEVSRNGDMLFCSGREFCSEKIIDSAFMRSAAHLLSAKAIFVSIPRRSCMYIIGDSAADDTIQEFVFIHGQTRQDNSFGNAPVSNLVWELRDGRIVGAKTAKRTAYDLHQSRIDEIENRMRALACDAVLVNDMGAECIYTGAGESEFFRIYSAEESGQETIYTVEATIDTEPPGVTTNGMQVQKGTSIFFRFALNNIQDPRLRERVYRARSENRLRYLFIRLLLTPDGKTDGVSVKEFNLDTGD